ncbi:hypothetical protein, partial [Candidatus Ichthyocystis sparus]|uniref:hypothetical protein n=1 Tax=Candidatus Ichthyocystis sparus TaxID=1561004 RepID=UPI001F5F7FDB
FLLSHPQPHISHIYYHLLLSCFNSLSVFCKTESTATGIPTTPRALITSSQQTLLNDLSYGSDELDGTLISLITHIKSGLYLE